MRLAAGRVLLLFFAFVLLVCPQPTFGATWPPAVGPIKLCYLLFGGVDDIGWTYTFNNARRGIHSRLQLAFPNLTFVSEATPGAFFVANRTTQLFEHINDKGCHVVLNNNDALLGMTPVEAASRFPDTKFISWANTISQGLLETRYPNLATWSLRYESAYYAVGVAAAASSQSCVAFLCAFEAVRTTQEAANGFIAGVRSVNATMPVHVVSMNSFYAPDAEDLVARLMLQKGCDVVARFTDPRTADLAIQSSGSSTAFSVGIHADLQYVVGDRVMVSVVEDFESVMWPIVRHMIAYGRANHTVLPLVGGLSTGAIKLSSVSPSVRPAVEVALRTAVARFATHDDVVCRSAGYTLRDGSAVPYASASVQCLPAGETLSAYLGGATSYPAFPTDIIQGGGCPPGQYILTNAVTVSVSCAPCPVGFYATGGGALIYACSKCAAGLDTRGATGAANCLPKDTSGELWGGLVAALLVAGMVVFGAWRYRRFRGHSLAPRTPPVCIIFTDIVSSTALWAAYPDAMHVAVEQHHKIIREQIESFGAYEVKTVGDAFMIAVASPTDALLLATAIQSELQAAVWPAELVVATVDAKDRSSNKNHAVGGDASVNHTNGPPSAFYVDTINNGINGLRVRCGVHQCIEVSSKWDMIHERYDYYGNDVNLASRIQSAAEGGQILIQRSLLRAIELDRDGGGDLVLSSISWEDVDTPFTFKGFEGQTFECISVVPAELAERQKSYNLHGRPEATADDVPSFHDAPHDSSLNNPTADASGGDGGTTTQAATSQQQHIATFPRRLSNGSRASSRPESVGDLDHNHVATVLVRLWRLASKKPDALNGLRLCLQTVNNVPRTVTAPTRLIALTSNRMQDTKSMSTTVTARTDEAGKHPSTTISSSLPGR